MPVETRLGPYRIIRLINRGGQGSVFLGYDLRLQRRVAIKTHALPGQRAARRQCLREAQLVAAIDSPKVVQVYDVIDSSEHLAMVMEYVPGCDLEELLTAVRPSLGSILTVAADIAGALAAARQQRVVHGDLKASNVLITETGRAKLTDFGIARVAGQGLGTAGSRTALSPEQCLGRPLDVRSDLFVLGCLIYRMLSGVQPFCRGGQLDTRLLLEEQPAPLERLAAGDVPLPQELVELVNRLLQKDPADRPSNTHAVRRVLRNVSREIPLAAANTLLQEARPFFRREYADDIPPRLPQELVQAGRSRLAAASVNSPGGRLRRWLAARRFRAALALAPVLLAVTVALLLLQRGATPVYIEQPLLQVHADIRLPPGVSAAWLVETALVAVREELGPVAPSGPGAPRGTTLYSPGVMPPQPKLGEQLHIGLRCTAALCVYAIRREPGGVSGFRQAILFPDMPVEQWVQLIQSATTALYR